MSLFISEPKPRPLPPKPRPLPPKPKPLPKKPKPQPNYKDELNLTKWKIPNGF